MGRKLGSASWLRGASGPNRVAKAFRGKEGYKESKALDEKASKYLLSKNVKPITKKVLKSFKNKKYLSSKDITKLEKAGISSTHKVTKQGPIAGKDVKLRDIRKLGIVDTLKQTLKARSKKYDKIFSSGSPFVKRRKDAIKNLDKYIGKIESKYVTKHAKGGLIKGIPKLAKRGF